MIICTKKKCAIPSADILGGNIKTMHANDAAIFLNTAIKENTNQYIPLRKFGGKKTKINAPSLNKAVDI